jgi:catechol 2,3-dioxygenase-like lactoylglutathione lyase family enzyme
MKVVLDHVGIAVADLEASLEFFRDALGMHVEPPQDVPSQRVRAQFIAAGPSSLELLQATAPDSLSKIALLSHGPYPTCLPELRSNDSPLFSRPSARVFSSFPNVKIPWR